MVKPAPVFLIPGNVINNESDGAIRDVPNSPLMPET